MKFLFQSALSQKKISTVKFFLSLLQPHQLKHITQLIR
jgi:hypothetical protein